MSKFSEVAAEIGDLVTAKNEAYGNSFAKCGDFLRLLWPNGIGPEQYGDALAMVRIFDKQMRIATAKDALGESPYRDIAGYGILGAVKDAAAHKAPSGQPPLYTSHNCANYEIEQCVDCLHCDNFVRDEWTEKDQCRRCHNGGCAQRGLARQTTDCIRFEGTHP